MSESRDSLQARIDLARVTRTNEILISLESLEMLLAKIDELDWSYRMERNQRKRAEEQVYRVRMLADRVNANQGGSRWLTPTAVHMQLDRPTPWFGVAP